ncbi:VanW family protein [Cohnella caldifontis]|uniref:VanW family protein n=1 Tax=Cohnella caldifontis TaxID=3027471 RepID=UPI0023EDA08B|nr:VanW family protein [Cohnella sp. YIM B05605]
MNGSLPFLPWIGAALLLLPQQGQPTPADRPPAPERAPVIVHADRETYSLPGTSFIDPYKFGRLQSDLERRLYQAPVNARIGSSGAIVPERNGFRLDTSAFAERFFAGFYGGGPSAFPVPVRKTYAAVDSELLAGLREKQIGFYVTYYNVRNRSRAHNIALAAQAIDSRVVFPGESFSFNETVGIRTVARGYKRAPVIVRGELAEDIGGGICQVSSTLFNAADRAGLSIVSRYSHSRHVPYVPPGRDATVSWGGPDFAFRNLYNQPVLIRAYAGGGAMRVAIYSSDVIAYKPRSVPSMNKELPEEVSIESHPAYDKPAR